MDITNVLLGILFAFVLSTLLDMAFYFRVAKIQFLEDKKIKGQTRTYEVIQLAVIMIVLYLTFTLL